MDKFIPTNNVNWINLIFSQKCGILNRMCLYSDCAYSSSRDPFENKITRRFLARVHPCTKLKVVDALLLLSELAAKI